MYGAASPKTPGSYDGPGLVVEPLSGHIRQLSLAGRRVEVEPILQIKSSRPRRPVHSPRPPEAPPLSLSSDGGDLLGAKLADHNPVPGGARVVGGDLGSPARPQVRPHERQQRDGPAKFLANAGPKALTSTVAFLNKAIQTTEAR